MSHFSTEFAVLLCRETYIKADVSESPNDRNDRAIRVATAWYMRRVPSMPIILLSNDVENRQKATADGIKALSLPVRPWPVCSNLLSANLCLPVIP